MMKTPTDFQVGQLAHRIYDPEKAHEYYMRTRKLHPRQPGQAPPTAQAASRTAKPPPHTSAKKAPPTPREQQKAELRAAITNLSLKLHNLEELIQKKEAVLARDQQYAKQRTLQNKKGKGNAPKTAAQKQKAKQASKQYRQTHQAQLKNKANQAKSGGGGGGGSKGQGAKQPTPDSQKSIAQLKALATKVRGQLAIAKQKLAAL